MLWVLEPAGTLSIIPVMQISSKITSIEKSIIPFAVERSGKKATMNKKVAISEITDKINVKIFIILVFVVVGIG